MSDQTEYYAQFSGSSNHNEKMTAALKFAIDVRKFEIELYWRRAAYFWAFSAAALGAYLAAIGSASVANKADLQLVISAVGLVFSWAWYLVNRASKFWQLNWEHHVDLLEDHYMGPIYKTVLHQSPRLWQIDAPLKVSASKINQLLSLFVAIVFLILFASTLAADYRLTLAQWEPLPTLLPLATGLALFSLVWFPQKQEKNRPLLHVERREVRFSTTPPTESPAV